MHRSHLIVLAVILAVVAGVQVGTSARLDETSPKAKAEPHRSPAALALSSDGQRMLSANQSAGTVSLVDIAAGKVLHEVATGDKPAGIALSRDGRRGVVSHWSGYDIAILSIQADEIKVVGRVAVGPEPRGVAVSADGKTAYVAVGVSNEVVRVDLEKQAVSGRLEVGREPRGIALSPEGTRLVVANARSRNLTVISTAEWKVERTLNTQGDNLRQVAISADGLHGYIANMSNRGFATTKQNIDVGWVLGQRVTRVPLDGSGPFETLSLDPKGKAAADAHGVALSRDGRWVVVGLGGTHEIMIFRSEPSPLPWRANGNRDLIPGELLLNDGRFRRVDLGGRPTELAFAPDDKTLYVANYLEDAIQVVDVESATLTKTIALGRPSELSLARRGEILFHDASRSFNQWYSCNTCHSDGHTNGLDFDTMNDGWHDYSTAHKRSRKKVPTLRRVAETGPWTWHGWQKSLDDAMLESFTKSMQGKAPSNDDVAALVAYLRTLDYPPNPNREPDGSLSEVARRGEALFRSAKAACSKCHGGPEFTDGKIHVVGLEESGDVYRGYNPPSLRGTYDKDPYLHDGRAKTLHDVLKNEHSPEVANGSEALSDQEISDLIAYLKSL
jgi:YVTN family beta-propeller protein